MELVTEMDYKLADCWLLLQERWRSFAPQAFYWQLPGIMKVGAWELISTNTHDHYYLSAHLPRPFNLTIYIKLCFADVAGSWVCLQKGEELKYATTTEAVHCLKQWGDPAAVLEQLQQLTQWLVWNEELTEKSRRHWTEWLREEDKVCLMATLVSNNELQSQLASLPFPLQLLGTAFYLLWVAVTQAPKLSAGSVTVGACTLKWSPSQEPRMIIIWRGDEKRLR